MTAPGLPGELNGFLKNRSKKPGTDTQKSSSPSRSAPGVEAEVDGPDTEQHATSR
ncbi:hypothetical protein D187_002828 [Cystobacter fuscus DSM 2262]|uniref:Uncharacterized protein n=1 Tax=Cystobacter fuscus (strain ATCC 25194 / DSM 2262 / NBRC 100088 / M29) TaxID=1242864 RepID=S9QRT6_CYSF2|nr:hypothetical protein D187_002828 [Cystobacter fuscus DSM 2262]